jgi:hypothetical protein
MLESAATADSFVKALHHLRGSLQAPLRAPFHETLWQSSNGVRAWLSCSWSEEIDSASVAPAWLRSRRTRCPDMPPEGALDVLPRSAKVRGTVVQRPPRTRCGFYFLNCTSTGFIFYSVIFEMKKRLSGRATPA